MVSLNKVDSIHPSLPLLRARKTIKAAASKVHGPGCAVKHRHHHYHQQNPMALDDPPSPYRVVNYSVVTEAVSSEFLQSGQRRDKGFHSRAHTLGLCDPSIANFFSC